MGKLLHVLLLTFVYLLISLFLLDEEAPTLTCPNVMSATDTGLSSSSTVVINSAATDNVDTDPTVICSHTSADTFLIGDTTVNCSSTDNAGNTGTCLLIVTVIGKVLFFYKHKNFQEFRMTLFMKFLFAFYAFTFP